MNELQEWARQRLDAFFQKAERPDWEARWQLVFAAADDLTEAEGIWKELMSTFWKPLQSCVRQDRRDLLLARVVYEAEQLGIELFRAGEHVFPDREGHPDLMIDTLATTPSGRQVKWYISEDDADLVIWIREGTGPYRQTLVLSSLPGELQQFLAYKDVERGGLALAAVELTPYYDVVVASGESGH